MKLVTTGPPDGSTCQSLEFAVGFGPVLMQMINKRGERISLRALPFGGYVRMLQNADFPQQKTAKATVDSGWPFSQEPGI